MNTFSYHSGRLVGKAEIDDASEVWFADRFGGAGFGHVTCSRLARSCPQMAGLMNNGCSFSFPGYVGADMGNETLAMHVFRLHQMETRALVGSDQMELRLFSIC